VRVTVREDHATQTSHDLQAVLGRLVRRLRAENSLPLRHAIVLGLLERDGPLGTSELAQRERMRPQSMAETVKELEANGLVGRSPDPSDGRRVWISLTASGREKVRRNRARREEWLARAIAQELTTREEAALARSVELLRRIADS
jgi:DNA-binding MarR family transcriptional regulator